MTSLPDPSNVSEAQEDVLLLLHELGRVEAQDGYRDGLDWVVKVIVDGRLAGKSRAFLVCVWPGGEITWSVHR
jgi:hypothetical protein